MALYDQSSLLVSYTNSGNAYIDALLTADPDAQYKWGTVSGEKYQISFSFPWAGGATAQFEAGYTEPTSPDHAALNAGQMAGVRTALARWADVAAITFTEVAEQDGMVGDIRVAITGMDADTWGYAWYPFPGSSIGGDIWISSGFATDTNFGPGTYNFNATMHEIGHALGLDHPFEGTLIPAGYDNRRYTIMSYTDPADVYYYNRLTGKTEYLIETPMVYDILAIQYLYGPNMNHAAGDTVYRFDPADPFIRTIWDAGGSDLIDLSAFTQACNVNLNDGSYSTLRFDNYVAANNLGIAFNCFIEKVTTGAGYDNVIGNEYANSIIAGGGNDRISGGAGNDLILGGTGNDLINGGAGRDVASYAGAAAGVIVSLAISGEQNTGGAGLDTLSLVEGLTGSSRDDRLTGNTGANTLTGGAGNDVLSGGGGNDVLRGGAGRDTLTGGGGADSFRFLSTAETDGSWVDRITDFARGQGDHIDLSAIDARVATAGDDAFQLIANAPSASRADAEGRIWFSAGYLYGSTDTDVAAEFRIELTGVTGLTAADFIL